MAESSLRNLDRAGGFLQVGGRAAAAAAAKHRRRRYFDAWLMCVMQSGATDHFYVGVKDGRRCLRRDDDNTTLSH